MQLLARAFLVFFAIMAGVIGVRAEDRAIIVLDASGSMWGQIDGKPKLEIAREALRTVLQSMPADLELGLMAYGHRQKGSCEDIELVVPPAKGTAAAITTAADQMKFLGKTPLSAAVKKAAEDLKYTEEKATVILITDGLETCQADPCALGKELEQAGVDFTAHVVGFGLTADEGKQVACLAENTGGKYVQASDARQLEEALKSTVAEAVKPAPEPAPQPAPPPAPEPAKVEFNIVPSAVLNEGGEELKTTDLSYSIARAKPDGTAGDYVSTEYGAWKGNLEPGDYIMTAKVDLASTEQKVTVEAGKMATPHFVLNAGRLNIRAVPSEGAEPDGDAQIIAEYPGGDSSANYGERKFVVPAGDTKITVKLGAGEVSETFKVAAGQVIDKDIVVGVGTAVISSVYAAGGEKVDSGNLYTRIFKATKKIDGTREQVAYDYGTDPDFDLPAGDYVAVVQMDAATVEQPLSMKVGERREETVVLNAGVLAVEAPGASEIRLFEGKANLQGERQGVTYAYGEAMQSTVPAGDYLLIVTPKGDGAKKEQPVTIKAGERSEVKVQ
ncbi:vWA domain-containing protein [Mesorhizobium denitrificans]|uniref:VWA domain-containing protein n=1 Tax=Mesorhizobium denitrificans TaxID=2294114 RepID=A0A371XCW1_9HYPH|nr:VWA domain-containing protein [Mesorhizobium denitrificans]